MQKKSYLNKLGGDKMKEILEIKPHNFGKCKVSGCNNSATMDINLQTSDAINLFYVCDKHFEKFKKLVDISYDNYQQYQNLETNQKNDLEKITNELFK